MNQSGLYYTLIFCCLVYIIFIGQRFTIKNFSFLPSKKTTEPVVVITQPLSLCMSNTQVHIHSTGNLFSGATEQAQEKEQFVAHALGIEMQQGNQEDVADSDQLPYFVGTLAKITKNATPWSFGLMQRKESFEQLSTAKSETSQQIDEFLQKLRLVLSALYYACNRVNAPLLSDRVEARFYLASMVVPGLIGRYFDCVLARALPRYFAQDGTFYSYNYDPYIIEDFITSLQHQYILLSDQRKVLHEFRREITQHAFNKHLNMAIQIVRKQEFSKDT